MVRGRTGEGSSPFTEMAGTSPAARSRRGTGGRRPARAAGQVGGEQGSRTRGLRAQRHCLGPGVNGTRQAQWARRPSRSFRTKLSLNSRCCRRAHTAPLRTDYQLMTAVHILEELGEERVMASRAAQNASPLRVLGHEGLFPERVHFRFLRLPTPSAAASLPSAVSARGWRAAARLGGLAARRSRRSLARV